MKTITLPLEEYEQLITENEKFKKSFANDDIRCVIHFEKTILFNQYMSILEIDGLKEKWIEKSNDVIEKLNNELSKKPWWKF